MPTEVAKFLLDPVKYATQTCINLQTGSGSGTTLGGFDANKSYSPCYFNLAPWSSSVFSATNQVMLEPTTTPGTGLITGYYVPYLAYGTITSNNASLVVLDNVPKSNPPYKFIFTGGQNGCSLLLLKGTSSSNVCALHYPNSDGKKNGYPLLSRINKSASDIILAIDFDLYGDTNNPNAASFFYYDGSEWIGVTQPQIQGAPDMTHKRNSMSINKAAKVRVVKENSIGTVG
ncbi:MAG: hypothetical protein MI864_24870 [Pseudomonadales bacterium]|uniref:Uncharacterized protein n=1 Tax=Oleiphilus messinensis TaxID=141451 RepID=A0A1Y0IIP3_9GAMM|nr:hypothetical protein [Oleiphilus messinensis]ARU59303.1 hypothetical protein OLMES_5323 [Oleiphilus messinensis]MCG8613756.1 hypothetical protein [Pseudomonadales bacterium]